MTFTYTAKRGFIIWKSDVSIQKVDSSPLVIYGIVLVSYLV